MDRFQEVIEQIQKYFQKVFSILGDLLANLGLGKKDDEEA